MTNKTGATDQQSHPRLHEVVLDPTGDFIVAPDLGADLIRIFKVEDKNTLALGNMTTVATPDLSGPRHGGFAKVGSETYFYVATELSSQIIGWKVKYAGDSLDFGEALFMIPTAGSGNKVVEGGKGAELAISVSSDYSNSPTVD